MADAKPEKKEMETTESYRGPVREISNVERIYTAANDNRPKAKRRISTPGTSGRVPHVPFRRSAINRTAGVSSAIEKRVDVMKAVSVSRTMMWITGFIYPVQLCFALLYLIGLSSLITIEESFLDAIDVFDFGTAMTELMFYVSMVMLFMIGLLTLILALGLFWEKGVKVDGIALMVIAPICLVLYTFPIFNLVPWIILWCLYVVKSQVKE